MPDYWGHNKPKPGTPEYWKDKPPVPDYWGHNKPKPPVDENVSQESQLENTIPESSNQITEASGSGSNPMDTETFNSGYTVYRRL